MLSPSFSHFMTNKQILPVLHMESVPEALNVVSAIYRGGIDTVEIVLRSNVALDCISAIRQKLPEVTVGVGTIVHDYQVSDAVNSGAQFLISPSLTPSIGHQMINTGLPILPGVVTPTEITLALEMGLTELKFFPAEQYGGIATIKALSSVFSEVKFCPTGGISPKNLHQYLDVESIFAVGGSWMAPKKLINEKQWSDITKLTKQALDYTKKREVCL